MAGDGGALELIGGEDGQPDTITGRFVLSGGPVFDASVGDDRWVIVGDGVSQPLDGDALRLIEARDVLGGETVNFIRRGPNGWIIGGGAGQVQTMDALGEPTQNTGQFVSGSEVIGAEWNGNSWVIAGGTRAAVADNLLNSSKPNGVDISDVGEIRGVARAEDPTGGNSVSVFVFGSADVVSVTATGVASAATEIEAGLDITFARFVGGQLVVGTSDGRIGFFDDATRSVPSWTNVVSGAAVTSVEWSGTQYLVLGEGGVAQLVESDGNAVGSTVELGSNQRPVGAWFENSRWLVVFAESGFVNFRNADLSPLRELDTPLGESDILAADVSDSNVLIGGGNSEVRLMNKDGSTAADAVTLDTDGAIRAIGWNGTAFLAAGDGGAAQLVSADGTAMGPALALHGGNTIHFASWSGGFWLIGGEGNEVERVRADGTAAGTAELTDVARLHDARWNGTSWIVAGESVNGNAIYALIAGDGTVRSGPTEITGMPGAAYAAEYNGIEFLVAGSGGLIQRINKEGELNLDPIEVLEGFDIYDFFFNGDIYLASGEFGSVRRVSAEFQPLRVPLAVVDQNTARVGIWTRERGFAGGICIDDDTCYNGSCVGRLADGQCCDSACDRPCESCFESDTGEPDGTCAPVVAGKQPPLKPGGPDNPCPRQSEATCGTTGTCDGAGECAFYGSEVTCGDAFCSNGEYNPVSTCNGGGMCADPIVDRCAPYIGCSVTDGCATSCAADTDCVEGFECAEETCVEADDTMEEARPPSESGGDDGGCSTAPNPHSGVGIAFLLGLLGLTLARRR